MAKKKDEFDNFMEGMSGKTSRLASALRGDVEEATEELSSEERVSLAGGRNANKGRPAGGQHKVAKYKNKTFRISEDADAALLKISAKSGKSFKDLLDEAVNYLSSRYL